jgi:hypothetical protein
MFPECSLNAQVYFSLTYPECSLNVHWMFTEGSLNVQSLFPECSLNVPWMRRCTSLSRTLNVHWMFTECLLKVPWMFLECVGALLPHVPGSVRSGRVQSRAHCALLRPQRDARPLVRPELHACRRHAGNNYNTSNYNTRITDHPMGRNPKTLVDILRALHPRSGVSNRHVSRNV